MANRKVKLEKKEAESTPDLTYKDVVDILEVIDHSNGGELNLELEDLKLSVVKKVTPHRLAGETADHEKNRL